MLNVPEGKRKVTWSSRLLNEDYIGFIDQYECSGTENYAIVVNVTDGRIMAVYIPDLTVVDLFDHEKQYQEQRQRDIDAMGSAMYSGLG